MAYSITATDQDAPKKGSCVSAVRCVLEHSSNITIPRVWIGDMPRILVGLGCSVHSVTLSTMQKGDLIFLRIFPRNQFPKEYSFISHLMIAIGNQKVFHCSQARGKAQIEDLAQPIDAYAQNLLKRPLDNASLLLRYIDPRNLKTRRLYGTTLIPFPVPRPLSTLPFPKRVRRIILSFLT